MRSLRIVPQAIALTAASVVLLSGCALFPQIQSKVTACLELRDALTAASTDITAASSDLADDPEGGAAQIAEVADEFRAATEVITNDEVREAALEASAAFDEFSSVINDYAADPANADVDAITESSEKVAGLMTGLDEVCS